MGKSVQHVVPGIKAKRTMWNGDELLQMRDFIRINGTGDRLTDLANAQNQLRAGRQRELSTNKIVDDAYIRMANAKPCRTAKSVQTVMPVVHVTPVPSTATMTISVDQLAKVMLGLRAAGITIA